MHSILSSCFHFRNFGEGKREDGGDVEIKSTIILVEIIIILGEIMIILGEIATRGQPPKVKHQQVTSGRTNSRLRYTEDTHVEHGSAERNLRISTRCGVDIFFISIENRSRSRLWPHRMVPFPYKSIVRRQRAKGGYRSYGRRVGLVLVLYALKSEKKTNEGRRKRRTRGMSTYCAAVNRP